LRRRQLPKKDSPGGRVNLNQSIYNHLINRIAVTLYKTGPGVYNFASKVYARMYYMSNLIDRVTTNYTKISTSNLRTIYLVSNGNSQATIKSGIGRVESFFYSQLTAKEQSEFRVIPVMWNGKTFIARDEKQDSSKSKIFFRKHLDTWNPSTNDILFFQDLVIFGARDKSKILTFQHRCNFVFSIYDILPITHPEWFGENFNVAFSRYFDLVWTLADLLVVNSEKVKKDIESYVAEKDLSFRKYHPLIKKVNLWSVATPTPRAKKISDEGLGENFRIFSNTDPILLLLSTVEPRKGHKELIDAAKQAWVKGTKFNLLFVGQLGWISESFKTEFQDFLEIEASRAIWRNSVNDAELEELMNVSNILVSPSLDEGYGLPLAEALQRGLPVLANGIDTYQELFGGYAVFYGPGENFDSLEYALVNIESVISVGSNLLNSIKLPEIDSLSELISSFEEL
jgi:glycosyltransferase involved in cell wall biosynthesis